MKSHQTVFYPIISHVSTQRQPRSLGRDRFFRLPTTLAQSDPFISWLHGVVTFILDDHPYPRNPKEFRQRTYEIARHTQALKLSQGQADFLRMLMERTSVTLVDLWQGSHVVVLDRGELYDQWSKLPAARSRVSSHYSRVPTKQYGISFREHQLLFGKTAINGSTWFQMEAHGFDPSDIYNDPDLAVYHGQDYLKYRFHHMNVGPFGFSPHTETDDPIVLRYQPPTTRRLPIPKPSALNRLIRPRSLGMH